MDIDSLLLLIYRLICSIGLILLSINLFASYGWLVLATMPGILIAAEWLWSREVRRD